MLPTSKLPVEQTHFKTIPTVEMSYNGIHPPTAVDGELDKKLQALHTGVKPSYLGDDMDHSARPGRAALSPSPRLEERQRADREREAVKDMAESYSTILRCVGEDPSRQGLLKTPERAAKAMLYFTKGYDEKIAGESVTM